MKRLLLILLILFAAFMPGCAEEEGSDVAGDGTEVRVVRVIDGDTVEVEGGERVRYIGVDTPETYPQLEYYGPEAEAMNRELVGGRVVRLEKDVTDRDRYGRLLRYVYVDDVFVNAELVRLGCACASAYPPDVKHQQLFEQLEEEAREAHRGLWQ